MGMGRDFIKGILNRLRDLQYGTWSIDERLSSAKAEIGNLQAFLLVASDERSVADYEKRLRAAENEYRRLLKIARNRRSA